jgi:hypothetical protein
MAETWNDEEYYYDEYDYDEVPRRRWTTLALVLSGLVGAVIGFTCAVCLGSAGLAILLLSGGDTSSTQGPIPAPAVTVPIPPTPAVVAPESPMPPPPAPEVIPFNSGGLGLSQLEWELRHGQGSPGDPSGHIVYENGAYLVSFQEGNVWYIERQWSPDNPVTFDDARLQSGELIPADRQYIQTYSPEGRPEQVVDLYLSPSLQSRFRGNWWVGGAPGNFTVAFDVYDSGVNRMAITLGNNP